MGTTSGLQNQSLSGSIPDIHAKDLITPMDMLNTIRHLTHKDLEHKSFAELMLSMNEELGELSREVKIEDEVFGNGHKTPGPDGSIGEAVDVVIMALAIYYARFKTVNHMPLVKTLIIT